MSSAEPIWLKIVVIFVAAVTIGISIANMISFNKLRNSTCKELSSGSATTMFWINFILLVLSIILFSLAIWKIIYPGKCPDYINKSIPLDVYHVAGQYPTTGQLHSLYQVQGELTSGELSNQELAPGTREMLANVEQYQ